MKRANKTNPAYAVNRAADGRHRLTDKELKGGTDEYSKEENSA